MFQKM